MNTRLATCVACFLFALMTACGGSGGGDGGAGGAIPVVPNLSISDAVLAESDAGQAPMRFVVTLSGALNADVAFAYTTNAVTADAADFAMAQGSITIPAGATQATIEVTVNGDTAFETDETLTINLENIPATVNLGRRADRRYVGARQRLGEPLRRRDRALDRAVAGGAGHARRDACANAMDAAGNAFVVWLQDNDAADGFNDSFEIRARRYRNDPAGTWLTNWEPEIVVHDPDIRVSQFGFDAGPPLDVPGLAVDPDGNAILAWSENITGACIVRANRYDLSAAIPGWGPPENISGDAYPFAIFPHMAMDAAGDTVVVWQAGNSEAFGTTDISEIWANHCVR